ncbi:glycine--tRNA ligase [Jatrophihabitans sp. YIM 134969]
MLTLQDVLQKLNEFWTARGALMVQPFNTEVGAGTANPATTLRVLGPEPWRVAYVEPSVRPDDSRYGENPNRLQTHTQFQVILKPDPGNPQELYLESLQAIGIDLHAHDIRFVEDNWASPALGAWGLGWEVWLDGMEITQFTYFQQAGSLTLDPVSVEITYGIERIVMALQGVTHFKDIEYAPGISYGEAFGQSEYEMSRYYLDDADIDVQRQLYDLHVREAEEMLEARLPLPAYYNILKCSHTFNVLDSRGVVSTAERARAFGTMRRLSKAVAELWVARREELGFPLGSAPQLPVPTARELPAAGDAPATLLFEVGVEELPAAEVTRARDWLQTTLTERLGGTRLAFEHLHTFSTPRRIVAIVDGLAPKEDDATETVRGPKVSAAFDAEGNPTRAASGFAAKQGVDPSALDRIVVDGNEHVAIVRERLGRSAAEVLSPLLAQVVRDLRADRNMRWNDPELSYARAIRWLTVLLGDVEIPVTVSSLDSGRTTRVHRLAAEPVVEVPSADAYRGLLEQHDIVLEADDRRVAVLAGGRELAATVGGRIDESLDGAVVDEIVNLVEQPVPVLGHFDEQYLPLPPEILISVMRKHQRYLPVRSAEGTLLPYFVTFANGACDVATVAAGNEAVVRARFADASFFWAADRKVAPLEHKVGLSKLAFENTLGSMADRSARIAANAGAIVAAASVDSADAATVGRAAELAKFDLATQMVVEMTSLAGTMAGYYARDAGEPDAVASALEEMEHPRSSDDSLATTVPGAVLAVADRADLLAGLFAVGANPTGSSDPFALRRAALGLVATLRAFPELADVSVPAALDIAAGTIREQGVTVADDTLAAARQFVARRFEQSLLDEGHEVDLVGAILPLADEPGRAVAALTELEKLAGGAELDSLVEAVQRIRRLVKGTVAPNVLDRTPLTRPSEQELVRAYEAAAAELGRDTSITRLVEVSPPLAAAVQGMVDDVQVMDPDPAVRDARVGALSAVAALAARTGVDWDALSRATKRA